MGTVFIEQIVAGVEGWRAVFTVDGDLATEPVICWALVERNGDRTTRCIHPVVAMGGEITDATLAGNYVGVVGPGIDPATLKETIADAIAS